VLGEASRNVKGGMSPIGRRDRPSLGRASSAPASMDLATPMGYANSNGAQWNACDDVAATAQRRGGRGRRLMAGAALRSPAGGNPACRACGHPTDPFLPFGDLPLANGLIYPDLPHDAEARFALTLTLCPACALVQLAESTDPEALFRHYLYQTSTSAAFVDHARALAQRLIAERRLGPGNRVIEIASNDGYLLQHYRAAAVPVLGIEPALNIAELARRRGIDTICEFFSRDIADGLRREGRVADVVHAHNVLAHVPDLHGFVGAIATILAPDGVAVIEAPYLIDLIDNLEFDTVYHEHLCYFSLTPLVPLFARHGLQIAAVERIPVHGGSLRVFARHGGEPPPDRSVEGMLARERAWGVCAASTYRRFADAVTAFRPAFRQFLAGLRAGGKSIAAYGAAAKGTTLLNYCGIGRETIDFVVDRSPLKQGLTMPGVRLQILPAEELLVRQPDFTVLLAWNFADEILAQQAEYQRRGGRFVLPLPQPRVLHPGQDHSPALANTNRG
jgi:SAM-dependent methyltransferase